MFKFVIFDMNGVIVNDEKIHEQAWIIFGKRHNFSISPQEYKQNILGRIETETLRYLFKRELSKTELERYLTERAKIAMDLFKSKLAPIDGVIEFIKLLYKNQTPLALATAARKPYTGFILDGLNIRKYFKVLVTAEDIGKGKPNPEIYLKAAKLLGANAKDCIVFEDTVTGIKAAQAAGMKVVAIDTTHHKSELGLADKVISTFKGLTLEDIW